VSDETMLHLFLLPVVAYFLHYFINLSIEKKNPVWALLATAYALASMNSFLIVFSDPKIREALGWAH